MVMDDLYYSEQLNEYFPTRLDCLLYAHDGRGLGHVSRAVAIGLALKRIAPDARVLIISGSAQTGMLIGPGRLDWIKLPSYQTVLKGGVPTGETGDAGFYKSVLGKLRSHMLESMVATLRPACVLVDHNPAGKRKELLRAIDRRAELGTHWVLGIRGVVGEDPGLWSPHTAEVIGDYHSVFWYGDSRVLGTHPLDRLAAHFGRDINEMGYVSRLRELAPLVSGGSDAATERIGCTVSLPWLGESGEQLLADLERTLRSIERGGRVCQIFVSAADEEQVKARFAQIPDCRVSRISDRYIGSLLHSDSAVIFGGYNSLLDVTAAGIPAVVVLRTTRDGEQPEHLKNLQRAVGGRWQVIDSAELGGDRLRDGLQAVIGAPSVGPADVNIDGAENAARFLWDIVEQSR